MSIQAFLTTTISNSTTEISLRKDTPSVPPYDGHLDMVTQILNWFRNLQALNISWF